MGNYIVYIVYRAHPYNKAVPSFKQREIKNMNNTSKIVNAIVVIAIVVVGIFAYMSLSQPTGGDETVLLNGAGATFPYSFLEAMMNQYKQVKSTVTINYQLIGSGGGISALDGLFLFLFIQCHRVRKIFITYTKNLKDWLSQAIWFEGLRVRSLSAGYP